MQRIAVTMVLFLLALTLPAWAEDQTDEPTPFEQQFRNISEKGVDVAVYVSAGKALYSYDFGRLNNKLAYGGTDPFAERIDDWDFEMTVASTRDFFVGIGGGFWDQETGGSAVDASLEGWHILARWGSAVVDNRVVQVFPSFGIGYATQTLSLDGRLNTLDMSNLPRSGNADITQDGMLLEAAIRIDVFGAVPEKSQAAFLTAQGLTLGWQGMPIASDWERNGDKVSGIPDAFNSSFFVRYTIGFGVGIRMTTTGDEQ